MQTLYLLKYNNYHNRIVRKEANLSGYLPYLVGNNNPDENGNTGIVTSVNFINNNDVDTEQVVNWGGVTPDYLLVVEDNVIQSRWFVISAKKTRQGQYQLGLHRDTVVDFYNEAINAPCFIEKATLQQSNNLIFNKENMTFNQIKKSETLIKDETAMPWVCIYAARYKGGADEEKTSTSFNLSVEKGDIAISRTFSSVTEFNNWVLKQASDNGTKAESNLRITGFSGQHVVFRTKGGLTNQHQFEAAPYTRYPTGFYLGSYVDKGNSGTNIDENIPIIESQGTYDTSDNRLTTAQFRAATDYLFNSSGAITSFTAALANALGTSQDTTLWDELQTYRNTYVRVNMGSGIYKYYKVVAQNATSVSGSYKGTYTQNPQFKNVFSQMMTNLSQYTTLRGRASEPGNGWYGNYYPEINYYSDQISVTLQDVTNDFVQQQVNISANRYHLTDAPYDMFVLPYGDGMQLKNSMISGWTNVTSNKALSLKFANALLSKYAGDAGTIYDAQILPYCPLPNALVGVSGGVRYLDLNDSNAQAYTPIVETNVTVGYIYHANTSSFTRLINLAQPITIKNYKVESECDTYRLVSPNYNGVFEFNAAMNGGVNAINVVCTYRPFNPYIKLFPVWGRLYGENFGEGDYDARGLVCGGDFSLPVVTSAWEAYERQNKNYQASFDRTIQNLRVQQNVARIQEQYSIFAGAAGGATTGALTGAMIGGGYGAAIGGLIGGGASLLGGLKDRELNERLRRETIDYTKDQFGYQLGNIQALPQSLSKSVAYTVDNKYFPFLEYYTCSDEEKEALINKMKYNGMTVMTIGTIADYLLSERSYIKGKLIRVENFSGDYQILEALAEEIYKGVFI